MNQRTCAGRIRAEGDSRSITGDLIKQKPGSRDSMGDKGEAAQLATRVP